MKVTVDAKNLAEFVFECVVGFYEANAKVNYEIGEKKNEISYLLCSACLRGLCKGLRRSKKRFLRVTVKNIKANFGEDK